MQIVKLNLEVLKKAKERLYFLGTINFVDAFKSARAVRFYGSFENTVELVELAASAGARGTVKTIFDWGHQENDDPEPA